MCNVNMFGPRVLNMIFININSNSVVTEYSSKILINTIFNEYLLYL